MAQGMRYQPQGRLRLARTGITKSILWAIVPGTWGAQDIVTKRTFTTVGQRQHAYPGGVASGFGSVMGKANTDKITMPHAGAFPGARTYFFRVRRNGQGGGALGRMFDKTNGLSGQYMYWRSGTSQPSYAFYMGSNEYPTSDTGPAATYATGVWYDFVVTHTYNGTMHTVTTYGNGIRNNSQTFNGVNTDAPNTPFTIGNRADSARCWDGLISVAAAWNRELSQEEIRSLSETPWQLFAEPEEEFEIMATVTPEPVQNIISAAGSSTSAASVSAIGRAIAQAYGTSAGVAQTAGTTNTVFTVSGSSNSYASTGGLTVTLSQTTGSSAGKATAGGSAFTISTTQGSSTATATASGQGITIWHVAGQSSGVAAVAGSSSLGELIQTVVEAAGSSFSASTVAGQAQAVTGAVGAATGASSASGVGNTIVRVIGAAVAASGASGQGVTVATAGGTSNGTSGAQGVAVIVFQSNGMSISTAQAEAIAGSIVGAIGKSEGKATVSGVTQGGVHYTASGDKFNITIMLSPYKINLNPSPYVLELMPQKYAIKLK